MNAIFNDPYLKPERLANLKFYQYSAIDKSLIYKHVMNHWYNYALEYFPMWMAPNLITLLGFSFMILNIALLAAFLPTIIGQGPSWIYVSFSLGLFLYQTFDSIDGKQARRTGSSSALGHIFDHTIDSLNCATGGILQVASLAIGPSPLAVTLVLVGCVAMWFSTWEEYHTGTLYLGYFNGPTEGVLIACGIHLISGLIGPSFWMKHVSFSVAGRSIVDFRLYQAVAFAAFFSLVFIHVPECINNVRKSRRASNQRFLPTLTQHIPLVVFLALALAWPLSSNSHILTHSLRYSSHTGTHEAKAIGGIIEYAVLIMFSFGKLGPRIILARLTKAPFPWFNLGAFGPLAIGVMYVNLGTLFDGFVPEAHIERLLLHSSVLLAAISFLRWTYCLIDGFTHELKINCFTIKKPIEQTKV